MNQKRIFTYIMLVLSILCFSNIQAQDNSEKESSFKYISSAHFKDMFSNALMLGAFSEFVAPPVLEWNDHVSNFYTYREPHTMQYNTVITIGADLKLNLIEYTDRASLAIAVPLSFSLTSEEQFSFGKNITAATPYFLQFNFFGSAQKDSYYKRGFYAGIGMIHHMRLTELNVEFKDETNTFLYSTPAVRLGFKLFNIKDRNLSIDFVYGLNTTKSKYESAYGQYDEILNNYYFACRFMLQKSN